MCSTHHTTDSENVGLAGSWDVTGSEADGVVLRGNETGYENALIHEFAETFGLDEAMLKDMMKLGLNESNINEYGRLDKLEATADKQKAKLYFEALEQKKLTAPVVNRKLYELIRRFVLSGGCHIANAHTNLFAGTTHN